MASLRDQLTQSLVAAIAATPGWTSERRDWISSMRFDGKHAVVNILGETKEPESELFYTCTLRIGVAVFVHREKSDPIEDGGNDMRYLDRAVAEIERAVHSLDWQHEVTPRIVGHEVSPPAEPNVLTAGVELQVVYRHNYDDPDTYDPSYGDA